MNFKICICILGFDLMEVGQDEVTLRTGKQANRRSIQFVLQALLALFGKYVCRVFQFKKLWIILITFAGPFLLVWKILLEKISY